MKDLLRLWSGCSFSSVSHRCQAQRTTESITGDTREQLDTERAAEQRASGLKRHQVIKREVVIKRPSYV